jgi:hypothetical protein
MWRETFLTSRVFPGIYIIVQLPISLYCNLQLISEVNPVEKYNNNSIPYNMKHGGGGKYWHIGRGQDSMGLVGSDAFTAVTMKNIVFSDKKTVRTSQETYCVSAAEPSLLMLCKI